MMRLYISIAILTAALLYFSPSSFSEEGVQENSPVPPRQKLKVGDAAPSFRFIDINDQEKSADDYQDYIIVYSFAALPSREEAVEVMEKGGIEIAKLYPDLFVVYIGFLDVHRVPRAARWIVNPIIKRVVRNANKKSVETRKKFGIPDDHNSGMFHIVIDWTTEYLQLFGLEHAREFHCYVVKNGKIVGVIGPSTKNKAETFVDYFDSLAKELKKRE